MSEERSVLKTLDDYAVAYCSKDIESLMAVFDDGEDISLIGTGGDELCAGRDAIRDVFLRNFRDATATRFQWGWHHVTVVGGSAVVAMSLIIHLDTSDGSIQVPIRWTVAMIKRDDKWRWLHRNASVAADAQEEGSAYPVADKQ